MVPDWPWVGAAFAGYVAVLVCNPIRGFLVEGYDLLRGRGRLRLWLPLALFSLVPFSFGWFVQADVEVEAVQLSSMVSADGASLFSYTGGLRPAAEVSALEPKTRAALSIGVVFWSAWMVGVQFFVMVALYLGAVMPERDPGWKGLLDFAWRRTLRFWPGILVASLFPILSIWLPGLSVWLWPLAAVVALAFAFVQVSMLSGDRGFGAALTTNLDCWRRLWYDAFWFVVVAGMHLFLLHVTAGELGDWAVGKGLPTVLGDLVFALFRAALLVWLLAVWVLLFCSKTKNPTRRRIRP